MSGAARRSAGLLLLVFALSALPGCGDHIREVARERTCRANMNTLATDQALFRTANGRWATSTGELDRVAGRSVTLLCPNDLQPYRISVEGDDYTIECPCGVHGSIRTGTPSWAPTAAAPVRRSG